jgi:exopolysaccharide biosynthesis polyprenyl glycosylphosphotransferase
MWRHSFARSEPRQLVLLAGDGVIPLFSLTLAIVIYEHFSGKNVTWHPNQLICISTLLIASWLAFFYSVGIYEKNSNSTSKTFREFFFALGGVFLFFTVISYFLQYLNPVKTPLGLCLVLSATLSLGWHQLASNLVKAEKQSILFIGDDNIITELRQIINNQHPHLFRTINQGYNSFLGLDFDEIKKIIQKKNIISIIYSDKSFIPQNIKETLLRLRFKRLNLDENNLLIASQKEIFFPYLSEQLKRAVDLFLTMLLLPLALPALLICAAAIKLDSKGPIFFIQERLGLNGVPFTMIKFRTMINDAEKNTPQWCKDNDSRITRVGRVLRKWRLDELPQLLNVLKNDMSLVGPRPIRRHFTEMLAKEIPFYRLRLLAKPGLTGWAQVHSGHANTQESHAQMMQYDLFYLIHNSLWLDVLILMKTIRIIVLGKGR